MKASVAQRRRVWHAPIAIGLATTVGLVAGLAGDGPWDAVSWVGLGLPVAVCLWFGLVRRRQR